MMAFIDSRDGGLLLVSHFSLLLGMAAPVWLSTSFLPQIPEPRLLGKAAELLPDQCPIAASLQGPGIASLRGAGDSGSGAIMPYFAFAGIVMLGRGTLQPRRSGAGSGG